MNELYNILKLLESFLGRSHKGLSEDLQVQFDCPVCSMNKGLYEGDGKHNLEISLKKLKYNCWVCGQTENTHGSLSKLIRLHGNENILKQYKELIYSIKQSKLYELQFSKTDFIDVDENDFFQESAISLPSEFIPLKGVDRFNKRAYDYLLSRNINQKIIDKYNIGYIGYSKDKKLKNRIIIPSYDKFGMINYWVGRDFINDKTDKWRTKYINPQVEKSEIVFNENKINWYGDVNIVEGPFDHIIIPNSIPLLGKVLEKHFTLYNTLFINAKASINIFLDSDAYKNAVKLYCQLNTQNLYNKINIIPCPDNFDAALLFEKYGAYGICKTLKSKIKLPEFQSIY